MDFCKNTSILQLVICSTELIKTADYYKDNFLSFSFPDILVERPRRGSAGAGLQLHPGLGWSFDNHPDAGAGPGQLHLRS